MMSLTKLTPKGRHYYKRELAGPDAEGAAPRYWLEHPELAGRWLGRGAEALGIDGFVVSEVGFDRLYGAGRHPLTGAALGRGWDAESERAVAGYALGGGCELALACDMRVASDTATFGQPEVHLGIIPGAGGTQRLTRLVGPARAKDIILSGRRVTAGEALNIGLCDRIFPASVLQAEARAMALSFARGAVAAHALAKRAIDAAYDGSLADGLDLERDLFVEVFETDDAKTGVKSFLENGPGKAKFTGR